MSALPYTHPRRQTVTPDQIVPGDRVRVASTPPVYGTVLDRTVTGHLAIHGDNGRRILADRNSVTFHWRARW